MIGNDIVDIAEAKQKSNWQRPRFLEKLFTLQEQQLIKNSENPFLMVWRLWSMKESAYKLYIQINPSRFYNPKAFECSVQENSGMVRFHNFRCFVKTKSTLKYIISEARLKDDKMTSEAVIFNYNTSEKQSKALKAQILNFILKTYHIQKDNLSFHKNKFGVPIVRFNSKEINVSLTHHGNYGAFAISNSWKH